MLNVENIPIFSEEYFERVNILVFMAYYKWIYEVIIEM